MRDGVVDDERGSRYELGAGGDVAIAASRPVAGALDDAREKGSLVAPVCVFVIRDMGGHPGTRRLPSARP